jgi:hypothetical protein
MDTGQKHFRERFDQRSLNVLPLVCSFASWLRLPALPYALRSRNEATIEGIEVARHRVKKKVKCGDQNFSDVRALREAFPRRARVTKHRSRWDDVTRTS